MQTSISMDILVMESDVTEDQVFLSPSGGFAQNIIIFGADMSSPVHVDNKKKTF